MLGFIKCFKENPPQSLFKGGRQIEMPAMTNLSFSVLVNTAPFAQQGALSAYHFSKAVLTGGYKLPRIFFYSNGVHNANQMTNLPEDEINLMALWQQLADQYGVELVICVAAAQRRGLDRFAAGFKVSGLGQLVEAIMQTDRLVVFN